MNWRLPSLTAKDMVSILLKMGFKFAKQKGSHATYCHPDGRRTTVPVHPGDIPRPILKEILKQIKVTENEFENFL